MDHNKSEYLILGATGSIGAAVVNVLREQKTKATLLVRNPKKAQQLFGEDKNLEIIKGNVQDMEIVKQCAEGKKFIVHGVNYPYHQWQQNMPLVTEIIIQAATQSKATILFPGNVYNFGNSPTPIKEESKPVPCSMKGALRIKLEQILESAANDGLCKTVILRLPDFWGPNVTNGMIAPIFINALKGKPLPWFIRSDIPHQFVYIKDAARLFVRLSQQDDLADYEVFNYGGAIVDSVDSWFSQIAQQAGRPFRKKIIKKWMLNMVTPFNPAVAELKEMYYLLENTVVLNDEKIKTRFPQFEATKIEQAIDETLKWYRANLNWIN